MRGGTELRWVSTIEENTTLEEWGILYIGSAGGATDVLHMDLEQVHLEKGLEIWELRVDGLIGGHSGADIHLNRGNALKIAAALVLDMFEVGGGFRKGLLTTASACLSHDHDIYTSRNLMKSSWR